MRVNKEDYHMLSNNIRTIRKSKSLSQDELAVKLNVVRQTISKWENGLSVPDSEMLIALSDALDTPVSVLLGEDVLESEIDDLKILSEKLEVINLQIIKQKEQKKVILRCLIIFLLIMTLVIFLVLAKVNSPYLAWNYDDPETAFMGVSFHIFEWVFIRMAPFIIIVVLGMYFIRRNKSR